MNGHANVKLNGGPRAVKTKTANGAGTGNGTGKGNGCDTCNGLTKAVNGDKAVDEAWSREFLPPPLTLDDPVRALKVMRELSCLALDGAALLRVGEVFEEELERGLHDLPSSLQMENTYVPELPDGTEEGRFLALDLGGTNFRVLLLELEAGRVLREDVKHYHISDPLRLGPGADLFDFLADCVLDFVRSEGLEEEHLPLGFTFSFPMHLHSISSGSLTTWTKSFKCSGVAGADVAALLSRALEARRLRVTVQVLLNDTTGTLVAGAATRPDVVIGAIMGTGSNGCYVEDASRVCHWESEHARVTGVVVDVEWGAFGDNGCLDFLKTELDRIVDERSLLATSFTFEKYIGGKYLGSVASAALRALAAAGLAPARLRHDALATADLSMFEQENIDGATAGTLAALAAGAEGVGAAGVGAADARGGGAAVWGDDDARVAQYVARMVTTRAAQLLSVCIAALVRRVSRPHAAVAVDGSVYKRHPRVRHLVDRYVALLAPGCQFTLFNAEDGSGKGSALTAAVAARIAARNADSN